MASPTSTGADVSDSNVAPPTHPSPPSPPGPKPSTNQSTQTSDSSSLPQAGGERTSKDAAEDAIIPALKVAPDVPIIPRARKCTFSQFVNRFSLDEAGYAIEYLEAGTELGLEMAQEVASRRRSKVKGYEDENTGEYKSRRFDGVLSNSDWIQAVRIQSQTILKALSEVTGYAWATEPHTFMRPFGHLIHFHSKIKEKLVSLQADSSTASSTAERDDSLDNQDGIKHLECYVSFVENHLLPLFHQFDDASHSSPRRIRYDDLWYLFRPGELVYVPLKTLDDWKDGRKAPLPKNAVCQNIWRLEVFEPCESDLELPLRGTDSEPESFAGLYYIDYDGSSYKPVRGEFPIKRFNGEKDIRSLEIYPIRFAASSETLKEESRRWGQHFIKCVEQRHVSYKAWTLPNDPIGRYGRNNRGNIMTSPELVEGDVVIDFREFFNAEPLWKLNYGLGIEGDWTSCLQTTRDKFPILLWSDASRSKLLYQWPDIVVSDDDIIFLERTAFGRQDPYGTAGLEKPQEDDAVLLPRRLCGYGLRDRKFALLDVREVKTDRGGSNAFENLHIDPANKHIIDCLLIDHFNTKQARKTSDIPSQDPIPGKGRNLVILLHGPPGVGKTATAEAMALRYRKPLFSITSGDLGSTPAAVEASLTSIFHLANVWDCILLLDEADVFLEERERTMLQRNAVVSVFLRVMEYYNGILFLTTNRPAQLDEAIKSRVHVALLYRTLTLSQTRDIFRTNISRLEYIEGERRKAASDSPKGYRYLQPDTAGIMDFAEKHWKQHETDEVGRWNGRQIRNAFISAAALARSDPDHGERRVAVLTDRHFETIADSITAFDKYMVAARGALDSKRALDRMDRDDRFGFDEDASSSPVRTRRSPFRLSPAPAPSNTPPTQPPLPAPTYYVTTPQPQQPAFLPATTLVSQVPGGYPYTMQAPPTYAAPSPGVWQSTPGQQQFGGQTMPQQAAQPLHPHPQGQQQQQQQQQHQQHQQQQQQQQFAALGTNMAIDHTGMATPASGTGTVLPM